MKTTAFLATIFFCIFFTGNANAQSKSPLRSHDYFGSPLNIPLQLAANFGEIRTDHFHMGLDIRTQNKENLPVFTVADGYISRIKIEKYGYGKAIYITHTSGYTTLYGHLNTFYPQLEEYVKLKQYADESWEQDFYLSANKFVVRKGQFIAFSGSTGASQGPHLHFEVYDNETGNNLNPELFGFYIPDDIAPKVFGLYWYSRQYSTYTLPANQIPIRYKNNEYTSVKKIIEVGSPLISFGIQAEDKNNGSPFLFGIYQAELWLDDSLLHAFTLNNFSYEDSRYVNACIDYTKWITTRKRIQHLSTLPGNHLPIFSEAGSNGIITLNDTSTHNIKILISDVSGNTSVIHFNIKYNAALQKNFTYPSNSILCVPNKINQLTGSKSKVKFSELAFYDTVPFMLTELPGTESNQVSPFINLHNASVPVHDDYDILIKTTLPANNPLRDKTVMQLSSDNRKYIMKGEWEGDWMQGNFNKLGKIRLLVDTIPPAITIIRWPKDSVFYETQNLIIKCTDNLEKIDSFRGEAEGQWLLFSKKGDYFIYKFDGLCPGGKHELNITVTDAAGNKTTKIFSFVKQ